MSASSSGDASSGGDASSSGDDLEAARRAFEAKVRATPRSAPPAPGGKGSPPALLATGVVGTGALAACAALLGGGLLFVPAAIPLVTVVAVLVSRRLATKS